MKIRFGIKLKILLTMLALSGGAFLVASFLTFSNMKGLGDYTMAECDKLGNNALSDTRNALLENAKDKLQSLVYEQATITNLQFKRFSDELSAVCELAGIFLQGQATPIFGSGLKYLPAARPKNIMRYSSLYAAAKKPSKEETIRLSTLHSLFRFFFGNHDNLDQMFAGTPDGIFIGYPWNLQPTGYDPRKREWYKMAAAAKKIIWYGPYVSSYGNKLVLTCVKAVRDKDGKLLAVCGMDVTINTITRGFISEQLAPDATAFLLDAKGRVLADKSMDSGDLNWRDPFKKTNLFALYGGLLRNITAEMIVGKRGIQDFRNPGGKQFYVAYAPIKETGWSVGAFIEARKLTALAKDTELTIKRITGRHEKTIRHFMWRSFEAYGIIGLLVLAGIFASGIILSGKITAPVLLLKKKAEDIGQGKWDGREILHSGDELQQLDRTLDQMTADLRKYMADIAETVKQRERIEQEIAAAAAIQQAMQTSDFVPPEGLRLASFMRPARIVGGDFYDCFMLDADRMFFCIGDVAGKGVSTALFMARVKTLAAYEGAANVSPEKILFNINNLLCRDNEECMSATLTAGVLNIRTGKLSYSNAGYNPPALLENGRARLLETAPGMAVGPTPAGQEVFKLETYRLPPGAMMLYYSDGVTEATNEHNGLFGEQRLLDCVMQAGAPQATVEQTIRALEHFSDSEKPQDYDITMLCFAIDQKESDGT